MEHPICGICGKKEAKYNVDHSDLFVCSELCAQERFQGCKIGYEHANPLPVPGHEPSPKFEHNHGPPGNIFIQTEDLKGWIKAEEWQVKGYVGAIDQIQDDVYIFAPPTSHIDERFHVGSDWQRYWLWDRKEDSKRLFWDKTLNEIPPKF